MKKNILANFLGKFWGILSNFLFIPVYIKLLGFESYSIISFTLIIAGVMAILDAGLTATLSREFARNDNTKDERVRTYRTLESLYFIITAVCIAAIFFSADSIALKFLNLKSYSPSEVSLFLKIISFETGFQLLIRFYFGGLLGLEKQVKANFYQIGWGIVRNGFVVFLLFLLPTLKAFFLWQAFSTLLFTILVKFSLEKELTGKYSICFSINIEKEILKNVWKFAGGMLLIAIVAAVNTQMDKIMITRLLSVETLGYYTLALSLSQAIIIVVTPITTALLPRFTYQYSGGQSEEAAKLFNMAGLIVSILVFAIMANMSFFAKDLVWIWTNNLTIVHNTSDFMPILSISMGMSALVNLPYQIAIANGYTKLNNILGVLSLIITFPGYWLATQYYGAVGTALVFCCVQTITTFVYLYFINKKILKTRIITDIYLKQILLPLIISFGIAFIFSSLSGFIHDNRILKVFWIGISTIFCLFFTVLILVPKQMFKNILKLKNSPFK
ncbi:lipopolysaccharide biosynthesis protein [Chryseobacterium populi]|uniref:Membrane protein involved in the export of O-antigen and teichoic acid n=1 Tax=Chryseobacterium populi TaxID=1144316 RepID=J3CN97_9FLAO|nr:oligosaccharide flippase family protein [Chryseobacterium populi]EJL74921.1 membrane protein involved in the export of O-antigen and teichoic acid [Chryseobacterium populi]